MNTFDSYSQFCDWIDNAETDIIVKGCKAYDCDGHLMTILKTNVFHKLTGRDIVSDFSMLRTRIADVSGIQDPILTASRKKELCNARQVMMYILNNQGYNIREIARMMCRDRVTVRYGIRQVGEAISVREYNPELHDLCFNVMKCNGEIPM